MSRLAVLLSLFYITSCTTGARLRVMKPADITISQNIQTLILVNRHRPDPNKKGNTFINILEGFLTGEGIGSDRRGADACIDGLSRVLYNSPRFGAHRPSIELKGTGLATFPEPLPIEVIQRICASQDSVDGLVTIEAFDSDSKLSFSTSSKKKKDKDGREYTVVTHKVLANLQVTVGWRFYDAYNGNIIDQFRMNETIAFRAKGTSKQQAIMNLPSQDAIIQRAGRIIGDAYARRISPASLWVQRKFYSGGCPEFRIAKRHADLREWETSADIWKQLVDHPKLRIAKRATYNMALACEIFGDLDSAADWASKSYTMGNNEARSYHNILLRRIREEARLADQLQETE
ncbi:MAG: hypothetical protein GY810_06995 [Aureispira sp.]|nr:hypothetical protein [Aureispira sp.]